jgi:NADH dehydrogenase FAD-containing subunit
MGSGVIDSDHIIRDERDLLNRHVHHVLGEVTRIDTSNRELPVRYSEGMDEIAGTGGEVEAVYAYDYLVLATGAARSRGLERIKRDREPRAVASLL